MVVVDGPGGHGSRYGGRRRNGAPSPGYAPDRQRSAAWETGGEGLSLEILSARAGTLQGTPNASISHTSEKNSDRRRGRSF